MKPTLPTLLSFNGGYVDTAGYLASQGLFTAHVTGNFVTLAPARRPCPPGRWQKQEHEAQGAKFLRLPGTAETS